MSTDLYGYKVLKREGAKLTIKVFNLYEDDAGIFPSAWNPSFFYAIIGEMNCDLREEVKNKGEEAWYSEQAMERQSPHYIKRVEITDMKNVFSKKSFNYDYDDEGIWENEDKLPQVTYEIEVFDEKIVEPFAVGFSRGTTMYQIQFNSIIRLGQPREKSKTVSPGEAVKPLWENDIENVINALNSLDECPEYAIDYFNARPEEREKLLVRLRVLANEKELSQGSERVQEVAGLFSGFGLNEGANEVMLALVRRVTAKFDVLYTLSQLGISAGNHPTYIINALKEFYRQTKDKYALFFLDYILGMDTNDEKQLKSFRTKFKEFRDNDEDFTGTLFKYSSSAILEKNLDFIKEMKNSNSSEVEYVQKLIDLRKLNV